MNPEDIKVGMVLKFIGKNGWNADLEFANRFLVLGIPYIVEDIVEDIDIRGWISYVKFEGINKWFNTVMFEEYFENEISAIREVPKSSTKLMCKSDAIFEVTQWFPDPEYGEFVDNSDHVEKGKHFQYQTEEVYNKENSNVVSYRYYKCNKEGVDSFGVVYTQKSPKLISGNELLNIKPGNYIVKNKTTGNLMIMDEYSIQFFREIELV